MSMKDEITMGIGTHGLRKGHIINAINTGQSEWTPEMVYQDNQCDFGKWLYSCSPQDKSSSHYGKVKKLHEKFHKKAASVLEMALAGKKVEAESAIAENSEYSSISRELTTEMMAWRKNNS